MEMSHWHGCSLLRDYAWWRVVNSNWLNWFNCIPLCHFAACMFKITRGSTFKTYFLLATIMTHLFFNRNSWWNMMCCCTNCTCPIRWGHGNFQSTYAWVGTQCRRPMQRVMGTHQIIPKCVWTLRELCDQDTFKILQSYIKKTPEKSRRFNFTPLQLKSLINPFCSSEDNRP